MSNNIDVDTVNVAAIASALNKKFAEVATFVEDFTKTTGAIDGYWSSTESQKFKEGVEDLLAKITLFNNQYNSFYQSLNNMVGSYEGTEADLMAALKNATAESEEDSN